MLWIQIFWTGSKACKLAANKEDLAVDLLRMLVDSFADELDEMQQLIELEDFPQLEHVLHRLYGATRYVGAPTLQKVTGGFEQFRFQPCAKNAVRPMKNFVQDVLKYFDELKAVVEQVEQAAQQNFEATFELKPLKWLSP